MPHVRARPIAAAAIVAVLAALGASSAGAGAATPTHWLCLPGMASNPCAPGLTTRLITPSGTLLSQRPVARPRAPKVDCFYVYPTVSDQPTATASFRVDPELRSIAFYQASRYSQVCRVFAPVYRQVTLAGIAGRATPTAAQTERAYRDVRDAWRSYLRRDNRGRGVVLIGHSQGTFVLRRLVAEEVDRKPAVRRRLVSAILLGGNVLVRHGSDRGGDFAHIRACRSQRQLGCVIAFSTFSARPPANSLFGRPRQRFGVGPRNLSGLEVLCTNPGSLGGGPAALDTIFPTIPFAPGTTIGLTTRAVGFALPKASAPWVEARGAYVARCSRAGGANVLRIAGEGGAPVLHDVPDATWGLHLVDANIALGDLVRIVRAQAARYAAR